MDRETFRAIDRLLDPLRRKLRLVASKAIVELVKDSIGLQGLQLSVLSDEVTDDDTEHMQPGGLTHVPLAGSEGIYLSIGGVRDDGVAICVSHRAHRPKDGQPGETALYNEGERQSTIWLRQDGSIELTARTGGEPTTLIFAADRSITVENGDGSIALAQDGNVTINGVVIDVDGNVAAPGEVTAMSSSPAASVKLSKHTHPDAMGLTQSPTPGT